MEKNDTSRARTEESKTAMLEALEKYKGIVTSSAQAVGIHRSTHYQWLREDHDYAEAVAEIQDVALDFVESQLLKRVEAEDTHAIIFYLKTKGRRRGYTERVEHQIGHNHNDMDEEALKKEIERLDYVMKELDY